MSKNDTQKKILVWDLPTRLCHWSMAISILYAWYAVEILEDMEQHFWAGYSILSLILFRLIWGFVGTRHARFSSFIFPLAEIKGYAQTIFKKNTSNPAASSPTKYFGHNPLGSLSAFAMLLAIALQAATGLFNTDDYFFGPLNGLISKSLASDLSSIHELNFNILTGLIALHIFAIIFYRIRKKERLTQTMLTGKKPANTDGPDKDQAITGSRPLLAVIVLALSIGSVYLVANSFEDTQAVDDYYSY